MAATVKLYNTLTRSISDFTPINPDCVGVYCCGPTVYSFQHIGNFKTFIFEDILVRTLRLAGYTVKHVMNITDVGHLTGDDDAGEDKMLVAMRREKKSSYEIAEFYTNKFFEDWDALGLNRPDVVCKASDHIQEMIELIQRIEDNNCAYFANGNVYFDVSRFERYGALAQLNLEQLRAGARIEIDPHKRNPQDFVLWFTKSKFENQELQWDSPWGRGYPGWHIECSAMAMKYLGEQFDIHCGGIDHIPVHHTNEIAQSEAATGRPWVNVWMHSEFILLNSEKMSKSTGKLLILDDIQAQGYTPRDYRFLCLSASYRAQLNFGWEAMDNAHRNIEKLTAAVSALKDSTAGKDICTDAAVPAYREEFQKALFQDLNTPLALSVMWKVINDKTADDETKLATLYYFDQVLGLSMRTMQAQQVEIPAEITKLLEQRMQARADKNWAEADRLRDAILEQGYTIKDSPDGPSLIKM